MAHPIVEFRPSASLPARAYSDFTALAAFTQPLMPSGMIATLV